nr:immunoglobulin light chain junction region [Macaca mulatta]
CQHHNSYPRTF